MIDWWYVGAHALWIGGLALLLATYSYRSGMHRRNRSGGTCAGGGAGACGPRTTVVSARCGGEAATTERNEATPGGATPLLTTPPERLLHRRSIMPISNETILKSRGDRVYAIGIMLVGLGICATSTGLGMRGIGCVLALVVLVQVCLDIWHIYR